MELLWYTTDERRFVLPLSYLSNHIFQELFKISEEEFGLSSSEHITLPSSNNSFLMNYMLSLVNRGLTVDMEKALLNSIITRSCSIILGYIRDEQAYSYCFGVTDQLALFCICIFL
ncbi:auxin-induced protein 6B-like [Pyrus ussuriensis x Pyrus communis]|uniref:Auxin-induced protein 6B-like n=1 Tax=Pyrus ussuriensis x Pyrus communis TaxID=2448454 RepID=A0A5N5I4Y7_9ROSA|nr:auxin-induced protein 6B-like [Pyrus ussuriensis x Pyrus communis]